MRRFTLYGVSGVLLAAAIFTGCYTVLRHPPVKRESYLSPEITHRDACNSCHTGFGVFSYRDPLRPQPPYTSPRLQDWNYYYNYPWWLDDVYYSEESRSAEQEGPLPIDPRRLGGRRGVDAYAPGISPAPAGAGRPFRKKAVTADSGKAVQKPLHKIVKPKTNRRNLKDHPAKIRERKKKKKKQ